MIKIVIKPTVNKFVSNEINKFGNWLIKNYDFPKQVMVDVTGAEFVYNSITMEKAVGTFFGPFENSELFPYIRLATGDFFQLVAETSKEIAIKKVLNTFAHEIQHYYQWLDEVPYDEDDAEYGAEELVEEYFDDLAGKLID